jgi:hypothetical protein
MPPQVAWVPFFLHAQCPLQPGILGQSMSPPQTSEGD